MKNVFVVNTCDEWKSYSSFDFVGVFTSRTKLNNVISDLIKEDEIELSQGRDNIPKSWNYLTIQELNNSLLYLYIDEVTLNEQQ